jgi:predicted PurR-regulated permease PerM
VVVLFACGQFFEGYVLTPRLVGDRVGLNPVWVIFALLAGGTLFGFVGLLLGVPAAAIIGVLIRFAAARYRESRYYRGDPSWPSSPSS